MSEKSDKDTPTKSDNKTPKKGKKGGKWNLFFMIMSRGSLPQLELNKF